MPSRAAELILKLHSDLVVLTPNIQRTRLDPSSSFDALEHERPRHDTNLRGTVTLALPKEARYDRIVVELVRILVPLPMLARRLKRTCFLQIGRQEITVHSVYHAYDTLKRSVTLNLHEASLKAGQHESACERRSRGRLS